MITLKHALKITNNARWNDKRVRLYNIYRGHDWNWFDMYDVLTQFDLRKIMVYKIEPCYSYDGKYLGMSYYCRTDVKDR